MNAAEDQVLGLFARNREIMSQRKARKLKSQRTVWEPSVGWLTTSEREMLEEQGCLPDGYKTLDERQRGFRLTHQKFKEICNYAR